MTLSPDTILNQRYRILSILGQGGMGSVYKAMDEVLGVEVAVKENLFLSDEYSRQFEQEARILAGMRHPNLPRVGDYFYITGQGQYLIMDYIDGEDLRERIDRLGCVPEKDVVLIGIEICNALTYLHNRPSSVLHRDIKPGNIKITPTGEVVLVDFGLAKVVEGDQVTRTGARAMTPGYSPPEQYGTARTDVRTDIYSLGATLYAALTGLIPEDALERATGRVKLTPLRQIKSNISRKLANVIEKALSVEPENRFQSAEEFKLALGAAINALEYTQSRPHIIPAPPKDRIPSQDDEEPAPVSSEQAIPVEKQVPAHTPAARFWIRMALFVCITVALATLYLLQPSLPSAVMIGLFTTATPFSSVAQANSTITDLTSRPAGSIQATPTRTPSPDPTSTFTPTPTPTSTLSPTPAPTGIGGGAGQIAFSSNRTGRFQIWLVQSDGTRLEQLTNLTDGACQPNWSPDGKKLAFISPCLTKVYLYESSMIYIMNLEDGQIEPMPGTMQGDFDPAWSPDGKNLAFTSIRNGNAHVFNYNFEDGSLQELSDTRFADMHPTWNPDGTQLAVARQNIYNHIFILSSRGFTQYDFSSAGNVDDYYPHWSPDGSYIIFNRVSEGTPSIPYLVGLLYEDHGTGKEYRIPALGSENDPGPIWDPVISSDGNWIAFEGWPDGRNHDIYLMDINGLQYIRVTTDPGIDFDSAWRPLRD